MAQPSKIEQLTFFEPTADEINAKRIEEVNESLHKVRKKLFAQHGEILKVILEMKNEFEHLKRAICRGNAE
jgi:ribosomal protein L29